MSIAVTVGMNGTFEIGRDDTDIRDKHDQLDIQIGSESERTITECRHNTSKRTGMKRVS